MATLRVDRDTSAPYSFAWSKDCDRRWSKGHPTVVDAIGQEVCRCIGNYGQETALGIAVALNAQHQSLMRGQP